MRVGRSLKSNRAPALHAGGLGFESGFFQKLDKKAWDKSHKQKKNLAKVPTSPYDSMDESVRKTHRQVCTYRKTKKRYHVHLTLHRANALEMSRVRPTIDGWI